MLYPSVVTSKLSMYSRYKAILPGFPKGPVDLARQQALGFPISNLLYEEIIEEQAKYGSDAMVGPTVDTQYVASRRLPVCHGHAERWPTRR
jgi:hypothetical protein